MLSTQVQKSFSLVPTNFNEAMTYSKLISESSFCPKEFRSKPGEVLVAMQFGMELGLSAIQSLQNIAVINGKPCIWGDAALGVVINHTSYVSHNEWYTGSLSDGTLTAHCSVVRKNSEEYIKSFSMDDAKKAGLLNKQGPWTQYPSRMLQMRARSFCLRDKFADALRGLNIREEVEDYEIKSVTPIKSNVKENVVDAVCEEIKKEEEKERDIEKDCLDISWANDIEELQSIYVSHYKYWVSKQNKENIQRIIDAKDKRKLDIEAALKEINETGEVKQ